jgi:N-acetylglucosaminyldiphosphoundecaprenol N-acetyl-beta-D-mannosaminyltransferase
LSTDRIAVCGIGFDPLTEEAAAQAVAAAVRGRRGGEELPLRVVTPNPLMARLAAREPRFMEVLNSSGLVLADGTGIVGAASRQGTPLPGRATGIGTAEKAASLLAGEHGSVFILGAKPGRAAAAAEELASRYPGLRVLGSADGYGDMSDPDAAARAVGSLRPDLLIVCLGMPAQEYWAADHAEALRGTGAVMCLGGAADVWSGAVRPAPARVRAARLEWLWRMAVEPRRFAALPELIAFRIGTRRRLFRRR